jgi:hypothetical protein
MADKQGTGCFSTLRIADLQYVLPVLKGIRFEGVKAEELSCSLDACRH